MADGEPRNGSSGGLRGADLIGLGGLLAGSVVGFTVLGIVLDKAADTSPVFAVIGVAVGIAGGAIGFWLRVRSALRDPDSS